MGLVTNDAAAMQKCSNKFELIALSLLPNFIRLCNELHRRSMPMLLSQKCVFRFQSVLIVFEVFIHIVLYFKEKICAIDPSSSSH